MDRRTHKKAMLVFIMIFSLAGMGIGATFSPIKIAQAQEIGPNEVQGKVLSIQTNVFRRGTIVVKSDQTGTTYTFYVGARTVYYPPRYPGIGETIKVQYINDRGFLKATRVEIVQGP
ncbi:MAG: hypothetical protein JRI46_05255 [Deltaproteobacteria bacterium]|nr:hypothetical protein [Deltaproteobacteria bacterium]